MSELPCTCDGSGVPLVAFDVVTIDYDYFTDDELFLSKASVPKLESNNLGVLRLMFNNRRNKEVNNVAFDALQSLIERKDGSLEIKQTHTSVFDDLVDLFDTHHIEIQIQIVQYLAKLSGHKACRGDIVYGLGWENIFRFLCAVEVEIKVACCELLGNLLVGKKFQKEIVDKGFPLCCDILKTTNDSGLKSVLYNLLASMAKSEEIEGHFIWYECKQYMVPSIMKFFIERDAAIALLCEISATSEPYVHSDIVNSGLLERMYSLLDYKQSGVHGNIALIFSRVGKTDVGRIRLESFSSFKCIIQLLTNEIPLIQWQGVGVIDVLADSDIILPTLKREGCLEALEQVTASESTQDQVRELSARVVKKLGSVL